MAEQSRLARPNRYKPLSRAAIAALAGGVAAIAALAGLYEHRRTLELDRTRTDSAIMVLHAQMRDHLDDREGVARAIAAAFNPGQPGVANALRRVDSRVLAFLPDIVSFVWVPRLEAGEAGQALEALAASGIAQPRLLGPGRATIDPAGISEPFHVVLDIIPKTAENLSSLGLVLSALPQPRAALADARASGDVAATAPLELVQLPGVKALVLYVPVAGEADGKAAPGYLGFSYRFDRLFGAALGKAGAEVLAVAIRDAGAPQAGIVFSSGVEAAAHAVGSSMLSFGGRSYEVTYRASAPPGATAWRRAALVSGLTALLLLLGLAASIHMQRAASRLDASLAAREEAESRLRVVVGELNHRVGNIFAVTQAIVGQALKHDRQTRDLLTSRLHSMAQATGLLAETEWRGASIGELVRRIGLPFADRVAARGPNLVLSPGAAQGLVLIIHELWTNAAKHGALSMPEGSVALTWRSEGDEFLLEWTERGGPVLTALPERHGFGRQLVERLGPASLGGAADLSVVDGALRYRLSAPLSGLMSRARPDAA